ncbi:hypothetical protein BDU57DRAFT_454841 [Ampelomyces quisqualis]|uniref:Uncharacterized protein n=1 Tax=Ampelomyces quisqualis TaxID=50730 RepID=A0A6A5QGK4_AMPQU|nr:hypothetical protein BDU57DRAFT_454841 [Ampelomyces quisqualis]
MPNFERLQYSNKESVKVNMGLTYGTRHDSNRISTASVGTHTNNPAVDVDFARLTAPMVASARQLGTAALIHKLLHPPPHAFVYGVLSMQWVIGVIGPQHIKFRNNDERYVLAFNSQLRTQGAAYGIPVLYREWLCGDDEEMSATEQGLHLTPGYFEEVSSDEM